MSYRRAAAAPLTLCPHELMSMHDQAAEGVRDLSEPEMGLRQLSRAGKLHRRQYINGETCNPRVTVELQ